MIIITKKRTIGLLSIIIILLLFIKLNNKKDIIKSGEDISIFVASDIHYFPKSLTDYSEGFKEFATAKDGKQLFYIEDIMDAFIGEINAKNPDFLIVSGDLTNNGEKQSHLELSDKFKSIEKTGTEVFVIPGNHDLLSIWAKGFREGSSYEVPSINHNEFEEIYGEFGYKDALSRDKSTLSYLAAPSDDIWLLMIDSNKYFADFGMPTNSGIITPQTLQWIKECNSLAKENNAKIITVMHHNLIQHSIRMSDGNTLENSTEIVEVFKDLGLNLTFSGHIHIQDIKGDKEENPSIYDIVNSALIVYPQQYGVLKYTNDNGYDYSKAQLDVDSWALKQGSTDENLLKFKEYSRNSFKSRPYDNAVAELVNIGTYTDNEIEDIANMVSDLNLRLFEGTINSIKKELFASPLYKTFINIESEYLYDFVYSMVHNGNLDSSKLKISNKTD